MSSLAKKPIKHLRWYIAFLLCLASALNYLDRQTLSILIGTIKDELHLTNADYGKINFWFLVSYGVMYAVSGRVIDFIGTRRGFMLFVSGWSVANMLHIFARTVAQFSFFRFLLGVFEPGSFTGGVRAVSEWFPMRDRALAIGIFNAGTAFGSMAAAPIVSFIAVQWGWRAAFLVTGALGFVWVAVWWALFRLPKDHPRLGEEERQLIQSDQGGEDENLHAVPLLEVLLVPQTWGCVIVRALTDPISYFLLFWIPLYFQMRHGFDLKQLGMFVWIPYAVAALGNITGGALPRFLISRGWKLDRARKSTMGLMTCLMPVCCLLATQVAHPAIAMTLVATMFFCHAAWGNITLPAEVFPKNAVGTVTGLGGALGSLMGALSQLYIGKAVGAYGFTPIFVACAGLYPIALVLVYFVIGRLGVIHAYSGDMRPVDVFFSFRGRSGRQDVWCVWLSQALLTACIGLLAWGCSYVVSVAPGGLIRYAIVAVMAVPLVAGLVVIGWMGLGVQVKRWHDLGFTGWMVLVNLIPGAGPLISFFMLGFLKGFSGPNKFER